MTSTLIPDASLDEVDPASFRDPSGFVYRRNGVLYRQVNVGFASGYTALMGSGLYEELTSRSWLVRHAEESLQMAASRSAHAVLRPEELPFISYPYEWSFTQLRDAGLLTLDIQLAALDRGLTLRDASAFNIQFVGARPVFIDTLSFGTYVEGQPWSAYRQFCEHFLAPLLLMSTRDVRLSVLHREFSDGVPLDLTSKLLGFTSWFSPKALLHIHLHARAQRKYDGRSGPHRTRAAGTITRSALRGIIGHLRSALQDLRWHPAGTEWADYEDSHNYSAADARGKEDLVRSFLARFRPTSVWDLGANTGMFSRIASEVCNRVCAFDSDSGAVDIAYRRLKKEQNDRILPLLVDLSNPSPSSGWAGEERKSLADRGKADCVMALALMHHIVLSRHVPIDRFVRFCASLGETAILEFVPFEDQQAQRLIVSRAEPCPGYSQQDFELAVSSSFRDWQKHSIGGSGRVLYYCGR